MKCPSCSEESSRIRVETDGTIGCHNCLGISETGGPKTDKILTRNSDRVTEQQIQNEGDMITPYVIDKNTKQVIPNEEFARRYPNQAAETFTEKEREDLGVAPAIVDTDDGKGIKFEGNEEEAIEEVVKS